MGEEGGEWVGGCAQGGGGGGGIGSNGGCGNLAVRGWPRGGGKSGRVHHRAKQEQKEPADIEKGREIENKPSQKKKKRIVGGATIMVDVYKGDVFSQRGGEREKKRRVQTNSKGGQKLTGSGG